MIQKLTPAHIARFPEFVEKWTAIGLSTDPADRPRAESALRQMYAQARLEHPRIVWCGSPMSNALTRSIVLSVAPPSVREIVANSVWESVRASVRSSVWESVRASVRASVGDSVWESVGDSVRDSVRDSVWSSVGDSVGDSVRDSVWESVRASVRSSVWESVWASVWDSVGDSVGASVRASVRDSVGDSVGASVRASVREIVANSVANSVWESVGDSVRDSVRDSVWSSVWDSVGESVYGQHDANWIGFYDFFRAVTHLKNQTLPLIPLTELAQSAGWAIPHEGIVWVCERHNILRRNSAGRLHCDGGPAVEYPDGWQIHALNGVRVSREQAEIPGEKMDPAQVLAEQNVEVRRELIRKVGVERMLSVLPNRVLDTVGNYSLLSIQLSEQIRDAKFLKMLNPSIGVWHVEGVHPDCATVQEAINWRADSKHWSPEVVT